MGEDAASQAVETFPGLFVQNHGQVGGTAREDVRAFCHWTSRLHQDVQITPSLKPFIHFTSLATDPFSHLWK